MSCATCSPSRAAGLARQDVWFDDGDGKPTANFIDLYKRACFVMEAKQGSEADNGRPSRFECTGAGRLANHGVKGWRY
jgi:hypothetical protein